MFKDYIANDIDNIFINSIEHAEIAEINGVQVSIVQDNDRLEYKINKTGFINGDVLFYISDLEYSKIPNLKKPPRTGEVLFYNGKATTITNVVSNVGIYEITLAFTGVR